MSENKNKVRFHVVLIVILSLMLIITTVVFAYSNVSVKDNLFVTGRIDIELNGGEVIFDGEDMNIEPGYSIVKDFTVKNTGTAAVYYRLYLENVKGDLMDALTFSIYDGDTLLYTASGEDFNKSSPLISNEVLNVNQTKTLTAIVKMEETSGNIYQGEQISFDITAEAVQVRNNPNKEFN